MVKANSYISLTESSVMKNRIWLSPPHFTGKELDYLKQTIDSNWVSVVGPQKNNFSSAISRYVKTPFVGLFNSGTSAIHLALKVLGVSKGDFVLTSTFTFIASVNPISYLGATPVFIESEAETWNISPQFLKEAIQWCVQQGKKPKAILLVHLYGMPAQIEAIKTIAQKYGIPLVEDAANAFGSTYKKQHLGTFGQLGTYSFNGNKIITTSAGGALISDDEELIDKAEFLASQAKADKPYYEHAELGFNYQMTTINAAIGLAQLEQIDNYIGLRRRNFEFYKEKLSPLGFQFLEELTSDYFSNRWITTILLDDEKHKFKPLDLKEVLDKEGIESRLLWKPMHIQPLYKDQPYFGDNLSIKLFKKGLCLPSGSSLSEADLDRVVSTIKKFVKS